jgi:hypothetical protein
MSPNPHTVRPKKMATFVVGIKYFCSSRYGIHPEAEGYFTIMARNDEGTAVVEHTYTDDRIDIRNVRIHAATINTPVKLVGECFTWIVERDAPTGGVKRWERVYAANIYTVCNICKRVGCEVYNYTSNGKPRTACYNCIKTLLIFKIKDIPKDTQRMIANMTAKFMFLIL